MTDRAAQLLDQALRLSEAERALIADALYASIEPSPEEQARIDAAWREEIHGRVERALAGEPGIPWEQVKAEAEERLRRRRG